MTTRTIKVDYLARVEGESSLSLKIHNGVVEHARLSIFEPPRFFEALLQGRRFEEAPDITARICGICPVAYQMSAVHAMEHAAGVTLPAALRDLRRLLYCGEWIESHVLHIHMLHAPDFLGFDDAIEMAQHHRREFDRGLRLKKIGNEIIRLLGGREIHPINVKVGGFYRVPNKEEFEELKADLQWAIEAAYDVVKWAAALPIPTLQRSYEFVALGGTHQYPLNEGHIVSSKGLDIPATEFEHHFEEYQVPDSTALYARTKAGSSYFVGPLARFNLNKDKLTPLARQATREVGLENGCSNPFQSIVVRSIEVLFAFEEALHLVEKYTKPDRPSVDVLPKNATGMAATEAPRGLLYHKYEVDGDGLIKTAQIVPPTSQNQTVIEEDLRAVATEYMDLPDRDLQWRCEKSVRNFDPCISCSAHFLTLNVDRGES